MRRIILSVIVCVGCILQAAASQRIIKPNNSTSEVEYGVECLQRICPAVMWDAWTFRDILWDNEDKTVLLIIQLKSWHEKNGLKEVTQENTQKETEWNVSNFKAAYRDQRDSSQIKCVGDWMLYLSVGHLLKKMEEDGYGLRIMLLKSDYLNQAWGEIPLELTAEQLKKIEAK